MKLGRKVTDVMEEATASIFMFNKYPLPIHPLKSKRVTLTP
jgi:hypothetical protein